MSRYIDADYVLVEAENIFSDMGDYGWLKRIFENPSTPSIEPKRGKWIDKGWKGDWQFETDGRGNCWYEYECSECGFRNKGGKSNFCPNCGADMREREGE